MDSTSLPKSTPLFRRVPEPEPFGRFSSDAPALQIGSGILPRFLLPKALLEKLLGKSVGFVQMAVRILPTLAGHFPDLYPGPNGDLFDGVHEAETLAFHQEGEDISRFAASEALVEAL